MNNKTLKAAFKTVFIGWCIILTFFGVIALECCLLMLNSIYIIPIVILLISLVFFWIGVLENKHE